MENNAEKKVLSGTVLIVDIDNNIANNEHRKHLLPNWDAFNAECYKDKPNTELIESLKKLAAKEDVSLVFITGRNNKEASVKGTIDWLQEQGFEDFKVCFRHHKDWTKNDECKVKSIKKWLSYHSVAEDVKMILSEDSEVVAKKFEDVFGSTYKFQSIVTDFKTNCENAVSQINTLAEITKNVDIAPKKLKV